MNIEASCLENFLTYLQSFPEGSLLFSSTRGCDVPASSFGKSAGDEKIGYEYALLSNGISVHFHCQSPVGDPFEEENLILQIADEKKFVLIPVKEGDSVQF